MRPSLVTCLVVMVCGCAEKTATIVGPPLTIALSDAASSPPILQSDAAGPVDAASNAAVPAAPTAAAPLPPPILASFVDVTPAGAKIDADACDTLYVGIASGIAKGLGESLSQGDILVVTAPASAELRGTGLAFVARVSHPGCDGKGGSRKSVVRARTAKPLTWGGGAMTAHLDLERDAGALPDDVYMGRLEGTAPVAEHVHPSSWEILGAVEASGTFTLAGAPQRIGARNIAVVPPGTKHSWQPDPGTKLVAFQMYTPSGPEQRFKQLAGAPRPGDAGADAKR